jgi:hypothetical protein
MKAQYIAGWYTLGYHNMKMSYMVSYCRTSSSDKVEHGITGDVLSVMDHMALTDLGITSLGHRLNLLRAVWELKRIQGLEIGEDEWSPQGECHEDHEIYVG